MKDVTVYIPVFGLDNARLAVISINSLIRESQDVLPTIVVSNNGACPNVKRKIMEIENFDKVHYVETQVALSMPKHFEFLTAECKTKYFMILPARRILYPGALNDFRSAMEENEELIACCSVYAEWDDVVDQIIKPPMRPDEVFSTSVLHDRLKAGFFGSRMDFWSTFPTGLNGFLRTSFVMEWRLRYREDFFSSISPDMNAAFSVIASQGLVYKFNNPRILMTGRSISNGNKGIFDVHPEYFKTIGDSAKFRYVDPVFSSSVFASIAEDYHRRLHVMDVKSYGDGPQNFPFLYLKKLICIEYFLKIINNNPFRGYIFGYMRALRLLDLTWIDFAKAFLVATSITLYKIAPKFLRVVLTNARGGVRASNSSFEGHLLMSKPLCRRP